MRKILLPCAIATNLLLAPQIFARQQSDFDFNFDQPNHSEFNNGRSNQKERLVKVVNEDVYDQKKFKIKRMFQLGSSEHKHKKLVKLIVVADAYGPRAKGRLVINNMPGHQVIQMDQFERKFVFKLPEHQSSLDRDLRSLQLEVRGRLHIQKIIAVLKSDNRIETITEDMWQSFQGQNIIAVKKALKLRQHQGKKLEFVEIEGDSARGRGQAQLMIDGSPVGGPQVFAKFGSTLKFKVPSHIAPIGQGIGKVQIKLKGNIYIESIKAGLRGRSGGSHQEPPRGRGHSETVDMDLSGNQTVYLSEVVNQLSPRLKNKALKSVIITVSSKRNRGKAKLCVSGRCSPAQNLTSLQTKISQQVFGEKLSELTLQTRGKVTIERIELKFQ